MNRLLRRVTAVVGLTASALVMSCCSTPAADQSSNPTITIGLTYTPNIQFSQFYVAAAKKYFEAEGVKVELRHHGANEDLFGAFQNGQEDLVFAGGDEIAQARSAGTDIQSVATLYRKYPAAMIVPADSPIKTAADVRGHSVGVPGQFGQTYFALRSLLELNGLKETDIKLRTIGFTQQAALTTNKVEAIMGYANNDAVQLEQAGTKVRVIPPFPEGQEQLVGPALGASSKAVKDKADAVKRVLRALDRATTDLIDNPGDAVEKSTEFIPTLTSADAKRNAKATLDATIPLLRGGSGKHFENDAATWQRMVDFAKRAKLFAGEAEVKAEESYTNALLP